MRKQITVLTAVVVVLACLSVAIVYSVDRKSKVQPVDPQVKALRSEVSRPQITLIEHDSVNEANLKNSAEQIITLNQQKATLCSQIKAAKLSQSLCN